MAVTVLRKYETSSAQNQRWHTIDIIRLTGTSAPIRPCPACATVQLSWPNVNRA